MRDGLHRKHHGHPRLPVRLRTGMRSWRSMAFAPTLRHQPLGVIGIFLLVLFVAIAVLAPAISPYDPAAIDLYHRLAPPSHAHWFGTDELGRDIFSRILAGARLSLMVAVSVVGLSLSLGLVLGGLAGFYGGRVDTLLNVFVMNAFLSFPGILLAIAFVAFLGPGMLNLVFALAIGGWVGYARLVRAQVLAVKEREFVEAARALGASDLRIFTRHILPNILQPIIVQAAIGMAGAVLAEATLSFLGLGLAATRGKLGRHAERRALAPLRFSPHGRLPRHRRHAVRALLQLHRRRAARLPRPPHPAVDRPMRAPGRPLIGVISIPTACSVQKRSKPCAASTTFCTPAMSATH